MKESFRLVAAPFTPLQPDGKADINRIDAYAGFLKDNRINGVFIAGTSGEGVRLSLKERKRVAERWISNQTDHFPVIVHTGGSCPEDTQELSAHAEGLKAAGISAMAPTFFKPGNIEELTLYCQSVAQSAPSTPFYYYHIPEMSGTRFPMRKFLPMAAERIETFAGIKFTCEDLHDYALTKEIAGESYELFWGVDNAMTSALAVGCSSAVGSMYNYAAPAFRSLIDCFASGDILRANACQLKIMKIVEILINSPLPVIETQKVIMRYTGMDLGPSTFCNLIEDFPAGEKEVHRLLDKLDFKAFHNRVKIPLEV